jgi:HEPN domain-containing protein
LSIERRNQLVEDIVASQPRLGSFVRALPSDMIAGSWDLLSYSYQQGFEALWDHARAESSGLLQRPLLSLWRQSVELALKAAILEVGGGLDRKLGHDLQELFGQLLKDRAALGHHDDDDLARDVTAMITLVQAFDPFADRFRYPTTRAGQPFEGITVDLDELFQAHWIIVTWCEGAAIEVKEGRYPG